MLGRAAHAPETTQGKQQPPFGIGAGVQDGRRFLRRDEVIAGPVLSDQAAGHVRKRVLRDQTAPDGRPKELLRHPAAPPDRVVGKLLIGRQPAAEIFALARGDPIQGATRPEELDQAAAGVPVERRRTALHVAPPLDVVVDEFCQGGHGRGLFVLVARDNQAGLRQLGMQIIGQSVDPLRR
ncbi:MAG: hypothetical protein ABSG68_11810 [Thermoguttaceae bacterium]